GMQPREQPLAYGTIEKTFQKLIPAIPGAQPVAVSDVKLLPGDLPDNGLPVYFDSQFLLEIIEHPHIVIAGEKIQGNAAVADLRQFSLEPDKTLWNDRTVFKPEIKNV